MFLGPGIRLNGYLIRLNGYLVTQAKKWCKIGMERIPRLLRLVIHCPVFLLKEDEGKHVV